MSEQTANDLATPSPTQAEIDASRLLGLGRDPASPEEPTPPGFEPANKPEPDKDKLQAKQQTRAMVADDKEKAPYRTRAAQPEK